MIVKLMLSTGKKIELTEEEYEELKVRKEYIYVPHNPCEVPPWWPNPWTNPTVTYSGGTV